MNRTVGQTIELPPTLKLTAAPTLTDASQNPIPLQSQTADNATTYRTEPISKPGVYTLNTGVSRLPIVVNVPNDEADIRTLDNAAIKRALGDIDLATLADQPPPDSLAVDESFETDSPATRIRCEATTWRVVAHNLVPRVPPNAPIAALTRAPSNLVISIDGEEHPIQLDKPLTVTLGEKRRTIIVRAP